MSGDEKSQGGSPPRFNFNHAVANAFASFVQMGSTPPDPDAMSRCLSALTGVRFQRADHVTNQETEQLDSRKDAPNTHQLGPLVSSTPHDKPSPSNEVEPEINSTVNSDANRDSSTSQLVQKKLQFPNSKSKRNTICQKSSISLPQKSSKTPDSITSAFRDIICPKGSHFDNEALRRPDMYPDGDQQILIDKVEGSEEVMPRVGWAHKTKHGKSRCLGVYMCPKYGPPIVFLATGNRCVS